MIGVAQQNYNGSRHLATLFSGMSFRLWAGTWYDQPVYQIWSLSPHYEDMKRDTKCGK